jgi:hypothetical protein
MMNKEKPSAKLYLLWPERGRDNPYILYELKRHEKRESKRKRTNTVRTFYDILYDVHISLLWRGNKRKQERGYILVRCDEFGE